MAHVQGDSLYVSCAFDGNWAHIVTVHRYDAAKWHDPWTPALVCGRCGEVWLKAEVGQLIDKIIQEHPQPKRYHQVPVFSLTEFSL